VSRNATTVPTDDSGLRLFRNRSWGDAPQIGRATAKKVLKPEN
jgi:hypothetical protein